MTDRDELAALMKDRLREVYMTATGEKYDAAFIMDDDPLNDVVVDGHVDFLDLADAILESGWVRCLHKNTTGFRNGYGPWHKKCSDCGKKWKE